MGPELRGTVDAAQAHAVRGLAALLKPGVQLRIERTRPTWCAGWLEDFTMEPGEGLADVFEHIRTEYGGQRYRVSVLGAGGTELFEGSIAIASQPRAAGKPITRDEWEGTAAARTSNPQQQPQARSEFEAMGSFLKLFMDQQARSADAQLGSVRDMVARSSEQTTALVNAVLERRETESRRPSLGEQLNELAESSRQLQRVGKQLFGAAAPKKRDDEDDDPLMRGALKKVGEEFIANVVTSAFARRNTPQPTPATVRNPVVKMPDALRRTTPDRRTS